MWTFSDALLLHSDACHTKACCSERVIVFLGYFDEAGKMDDIADPFMLPHSEYLLAYDIIARCCDGLMHRLTARGSVAAAP